MIQIFPGNRKGANSNVFGGKKAKPYLTVAPYKVRTSSGPKLPVWNGSQFLCCYDSASSYGVPTVMYGRNKGGSSCVHKYTETCEKKRSCSKKLYENVENVNKKLEKTVIVASEGEVKQEAASVTETAPLVAATEKTNVELSQQVAALENQNFELLTRLEALETMIVPTDAEIQAAPSSSMLAASMKNVLSVVS